MIRVCVARLYYYDNKACHASSTTKYQCRYQIQWHSGAKGKTLAYKKRVFFSERRLFFYFVADGL